ncbi:MAG: hypothetical protein WD028_11390 [Balneolaceae bacterium]
MNKIENHIQNISNAISDWLQPDNMELKHAIDQTVEENLFSFQDIRHQVLHLKESLKKENLLKWAEQSNLKHNSLRGKKVICLHAGNLPLVGLQDFLAVLLTGGIYIGKISKKDPYLLPTFISACQKNGVLRDAVWSVNLEELHNSEGDFLLFAGSESTAQKVNEKMSRFRIIKPDAPKLMRTAHFSIAFITDNKPSTMESLTEAIFRYGGAGCRSVAIVVAPFHLDSEKCSFTDYIESFWLKNPQHEKPTPALFHRYACNKAVEISQAWLDDFLIEEQVMLPTEKFLLYWVKGDEKKLEEIVNQFGKGLQSIYSTGDFLLKNTGQFEMEDLSAAQKPPVWWKPDGVDSIAWLQGNIS